MKNKRNKKAKRRSRRIGLYGRLDSLISVLRLLVEERLRRRAWWDPYPASFKMTDIKDAKLANDRVYIELLDGRRIEGTLADLNIREQDVLLDWAEVKSVEESLGMGAWERRPGQEPVEYKIWRGMEVDPDLREDYLEEINSIPNINIIHTCSGHCAGRRPKNMSFGFLLHHPAASYNASRYEREGLAELVTRMFGDLGTVEVAGDPDAQMDVFFVVGWPRRQDIDKDTFDAWWRASIDRLWNLSRYAD